MALTLKRYLTSLGAVCALMAVYCAVVVPLLEPPARVAVENVARGQEPKPNVWWQHLFADDAWQNSNPMLLQTEQGTLLFQSLRQLGPTQWQLSPLTLIVPLSRDRKGAVVGDISAASKIYQDSPLAIVVAPEGADIQFLKAPDWLNGSTEPLTGGLLRGPIQITGVDPKAGNAPQWSIKTANLLIDRRRVWTNNEVHISAGNSMAIGKDLSIVLKQDLLGPTDDDSGPWGLLDHLELIYVKQVSVELPPGGLWKGMKLGSAATAAAQADTPARVDLLCKGKFHFDFNKSLASLFDNIRIEHRYRGALIADEFLCHTLHATFSAPNRTLSVDPAAIMVGPMQLKAIDAEGVESNGPLAVQNTVQIRAPNILTELTAQSLQVQLDKRRFTIKHPSSVVELNYMGNIFHAPTVGYEAAPNDEHLGWLFASGPGDVQTDSSSEFGRTTARWQESLKMQPTEKGEIISFDGRALIEADARGHLASHHIDVTLIRSAPSVSEPMAIAEATGTTPGVSAMPGKSEYQVDRLDAAGEVVMGNQAQNVHVGLLHLQFVYPQKQAPQGSAAAMALNDSSGRPMIQLIGPPVGSASPMSSPPMQHPSAQQTRPSLSAVASIPSATYSGTTKPGTNPGSLDQGIHPPIGLPAATRLGRSPADPMKTGATGNVPVLILGKELHSQVIVTSDQSWIDHLNITGPVVISRDGPPPPGDPVWRIEGNQLQLASGASGQVDLQIVGQPARVTFGEGYIEGPVIRMDQRSGLVWMDHPGEICLPGNLVGSRTPGQSIEWLKPLKCRWQGHLLFNGTKANIEGDITIDGCARTSPDRLLFIGGSCQLLEVSLTQPIDISSPGATSATIHSLSLRRNVDIRTAQRDTSNRRLSLEEISVPELTYELPTNRIIGAGPGWLRSQHISSGAGGMGALASTTKESLGIPLAGQQSSLMQGVHLKFRETMEALLSEKQLSFFGKVEVGIGPVPSLEEVINLDTMRTLQPEQTLLAGDLLRVYDTSDLRRSSSTSSLAEGAWEFEAVGHVTFEGKREAGDFSGKAYRMVYAQAKDLLHIRGDKQVPAELQYRPQNSASIESSTLKMWSGSLNTKTMRPSSDSSEGQLELAPGSQVVPRRPPGSAAAPAIPFTPPISPRAAANDLFKGK